MMTRERGGASAALACAFVVLASCAPPPRPADTVVIASGADLESANPLVTVHPLSRQVQRYLLFVTLARYDSALQPQPYFARRWEWSGDRTTLTLHLDPALRWHDGAPTTARDVAFTLALARDPAVGYPRASDAAAIAGDSVVDDTTLVLRFRSAQPDLPALLCELPIVPRHRLATVDRADLRRAPFSTAPLGNGPFRFVHRDAGARWVFERNTSFPASLGGPPRLRRVVVAVVDEATTKFAGLVSGELDAAGIAPTMASLAARDPSLRVLSYPVLQSYALVFNAGRAPFDDVRVRRAVNASIDRARLVAAAVAGYGTPAAGAVPPDNPLALPPHAPLDVRLADSLLDAAGWRRGADGIRARGGRPLDVTLYTVATGDNPVEQLVQADLGARGIRVAIRQMELGAFLSAARARQRAFDMLLSGIPGDLSLAHLAGMFASSQAGGALDYGGYHSARLDAGFARAASATSDSARRDAWGEVQRALADEVPVAWLYHARGVQGLSARLHGVTMDLRGELVTLARWTVRSR
ncbi:ABC-type transporter, periplasmic subunit [Gemmatirosa kalamazoonensis]|uniref:ABC-type transporter, periplasmic subunit n=1 Tax=Gemmatirosa kalamazoonensis TaxID=861299 RepID=W0RJA3_9BACT|nr:peptide ABC transporter substrate-binding protein [Gemmatirosa kalamazoonensis]AHG91174.1 ABC-type transporter, periplasmic subunit [Gemmatirosa kalamazoonensis]